MSVTLGEFAGHPGEFSQLYGVGFTNISQM